MEFAVLNGQITELEKLDKSWLNYGTYFGDGVYEVIRSYNDKLFALDDHMLRLDNSLKALELDGVDAEIVREQIVAIFEKACIKNAKIYCQITRGCGERSHFIKKDIKPDVLILISSLPDSSQQKTDGIKVSTYPDLRWKRCDIKSLNLLANVMASRDAQKKGCDEAILVNDDNFITEGAGSGFFAIIDGKLQTTPLNENILPSISRKYILKAAKQLDIEIIEEHMTPDQAKDADELFIGVTTRDVVGVIEFDQKPISGGMVGKITRQIEAEFQKFV